MHKPEQYNSKPLHRADFSARLYFILWCVTTHLHHSISPDTKIPSHGVADF